jgi:hypothetical protein
MSAKERKYESAKTRKDESQMNSSIRELGNQSVKMGD